MITSLRLFINNANTLKTGINISEYVKNSNFGTISLESESDIIGDYDLGELTFDISIQVIHLLGYKSVDELKWNNNITLYYKEHIIFYGVISTINQSKRFDADYIQVRVDSIARLAGNWPLVPERNIIDADTDLQSLLEYDVANDEWLFIRQETLTSLLNYIIELANYSIDHAFDWGYVSGVTGGYPKTFKFKVQKKDIFADDIENIRTFKHEIVYETNFINQYKKLLAAEETIEDRDIKLLYKYVYKFFISGSFYRRNLALAIQVQDKEYEILFINSDGLESQGINKIKIGDDSTSIRQDFAMLSGKYFEAEFDADPPNNLRNYAETFINLQGSPISTFYIKYDPKTYYVIATYEDIDKILIFKINYQNQDIVTAKYSNSDSIKDGFRHIAELTNKILKYEYDGRPNYISRSIEENDLNIDKGSIVDIVIEDLDFDTQDFTLSDNIIITDEAKEDIENKQIRLISGLRQKITVEVIEKWNNINSAGELEPYGNIDPRTLLFKSKKVNGVFEKSLIKQVDINEDTLIFRGERIL